MSGNDFLRTFTDKLNNFYKSNKVFALIIVLQICTIAGMTLFSAVKPANDIDIPLSSLKITGNDSTVAEISEESIALCTTEDGEDTWISAGELYLPFGAYKLVFDYQSEYAEILNEKSVASVGIYGPERTEEVYYVSGFEKETDFLFWVDTITEKTPISFEFIYKNDNNVQINSVAIKENTAFRFVCVMAVAAAFAIMDIVCGCFISGDSKKKLRTATVIMAIAFVSAIPLMNGKLNVKHDILFHLNRIWEISEAFTAGNFPVRMMTGLLNGYSYPISIFYCDIFLYLPAILCCAGLALQTAYKVYIFLISLATAAIAYKSFNEIVKNDRISLLGSAIYTLCSYRLLNIYMRGALGEYTAMAFFPLIILGMYLVYTKEKITYKDWLPLSIGMSGVIMSHIISTEIVVIFLVIFCLMTLKKTFAPKRIAALIKAVVVTTLMCVWFVVPFFEYYITQDVQVGEVFTRIQTDGIGLKNILKIFMTTLKFEGGAALSKTPVVFGFVLIMGIATAGYYVINGKKWKCSNTAFFRASVKLMMISVIALCFTHSKFPWDFIQTVSGETIGKFLGNVQFPWRYLAVAAAAITFVTVISLAEIKKYSPKAQRFIMVCLSAAIVICTGYYYNDLNNNGAVFDKYYYRIPEEYTRQIGYSEYMLTGSEKDDSNYKLAAVKQGDAMVMDLYRKLDEKYLVCANNSDQPAVVEIPVFSYKYYKACDEETGETIKINTGSQNRIALDIPAGYSGTVKVEFCPPVHWRVAEFVSAATVAALAVWAVLKNKSSKNYDI